MPPRSPEAKARKREYMTQWRKDHPDYMVVYGQRRSTYLTQQRAALRLETMKRYGGDPPVCACCGVSELVFLTLDHPNGDGAAERRANGNKGGYQQYRLLKLAGYPAGYRVLCWNCNSAVHILGECPHAP